MSVLVAINITAAALLAGTCFLLVAVLSHKKQHPHYQAFLLLWGLFVVLASFVAYIMIESKINWPQPWANALDSITLLLLALAAYAIHRGPELRRDDSVWPVAGAVFLAYEVFIILAGYRIEAAPRFWQVIYTTPNMLLSAAGFIAVGVGLARDKALGSVRFALLILSAVYAILQPPFYYYDFMFSDAEGAPERSLLRLFVAIGKIIQLLALIVVVLSLSAEARGESGQKRGEAALGAMRIGVMLLSIGFSIFLFAYRFFDLIGKHMPTLR